LIAVLAGVLFTEAVTASEVAIPIKVPPGRAGMTPRLVLSYDISRGNGFFGVGWALNLGLIERDSRFGPPAYDGADMFRYSLGAESSLLVEDTGEPGTYYHHVGSSYMKFAYHSEGDYWTATSKTGTVYTFGRNLSGYYPGDTGLSWPNSRIETDKDTYRWLLERVEDTRGHYILYRYWYDWPDGLQRYPDAIYYTGSPSAGDALNKIVFHRRGVPREDAFSSYRNGSGEPIVTEHLIDSIGVYHDSSVVRTYALTYDTSTTARARLETIQEIGTYGTLAPTQSFEYNFSEEDDKTFAAHSTGIPWQLLGADGNLYSIQGRGIRFGDVDGNGAPDAVISQMNINICDGSDPGCIPSDVPIKAVYLNDGHGNFSAAPGWLVPSYSFIGADYFVQVVHDGPDEFVKYMGGKLFDADGDGLADMVTSGDYSTGIYFSDGATFSSSPDSGLPPNWLWKDPGTGLFETFVLDVDGDGLTDFLGNNTVWKNRIWYLGPNSYEEINVNLTGYDWGEFNGMGMGDFNGDGLLDLLQLDPGGQAVHLNRGDDSDSNRWEWQVSGWLIPQVWLEEGAVLGDFNGDGLTDIYVGRRETDRSETCTMYLCTGSGFVEDPGWHDGPILYDAVEEERRIYRATDFNGDGLDDFTEVGKTIFLNQYGASHRCEEMECVKRVPSFGAGPQRQSTSSGHGSHAFSTGDPRSRSADASTAGRRSGGSRDSASDREFAAPACTSKGHPFRRPTLSRESFVSSTPSLAADDWESWNTEYSTKALRADLMLLAENGLGGATRFCYRPSIDFENPTLPITMELIHEKRIYSDAAWTHSPFPAKVEPDFWKRFDYTDGYFCPETRRFSGFETVATLTSAQTATKVRYHVGHSLPVGDGLLDDYGDPVYDDWQLVGRPWRRETGRIRSLAGTFWFQAIRRVDLVWKNHALIGQGGFRESANFPHVETKILRLFETFGDPDFMERKVGFTYEFDTCNLHEIEDSGDLAVAGDEILKVIDYAKSEDLHILSTPSEVWIYGDEDGNGVMDEMKHVRYFYDGLSLGADPPQGLLTRTDVDLDTHGVPVGREYQYGAPDGLLSGILDELGPGRTSQVDFTYDPTNTFVAGLSTSVTEGKAAPVNLVHVYDHDPALGRVIREVLPTGRGLYYKYDDLGRLTVVSSTDPDTGAGVLTLREIEYSHDRYDSFLSTANKVRSRSFFTPSRFVDSYCYYDGLGRPRQARQSSERPRFYRAMEMEYARGLLSRVSNPFWAVGPTFDKPNLSQHPYTGLFYDALGRKVRIVHPDSTAKSMEYRLLNSYFEDEAGDPKWIYRDVMGREILIEEDDGLGAVSSRTFGYDPLGRLIRTEDSAGNLTSLSYDSFGRRLTLDDPDHGLITFQYGYRDLESITDARGLVTTLTFDELGRPLEKNYLNPPEPEHPAGFVFSYDGAGSSGDLGRLTRSILSDGLGALLEDSFSHDLWGRSILGERWVRDRNGGQPYATEVTYNMGGGVTRLGYPNNQGGLLYKYNDVGLPASVVEEGSGLIYANAFDADVAYNEIGQLLGLEFHNSVTSTWSYDSLNFRTERITSMNPGGIFQDLLYGYTPDGNVERISDNVFTGPTGYESMTQYFTYDQMDRLIYATGDAYGDLTYTYDELGNLTHVDGAMDETYLYGGPEPHAPTGLYSPASSPDHVFTYDASGNLDIKATDTEMWDHDFDFDGRLCKITYNGSKTSRFHYDSAGERFLKEIYSAAVPETTVYVGGIYEQRIGSGGTEHVKHVHGFGKRLATLTDNDPATLIFYHPDLRGTTNEATDAAGQPKADMRVRHTPFGRELNPAGSLYDGMRFRFTGQERDAEKEISLDYFHARYYDPVTRHFISPDPLVPDPTNTQDYNRYAYVRNNPMTLVDPSGLDPINGDWGSSSDSGGFGYDTGPDYDKIWYKNSNGEVVWEETYYYGDESSSGNSDNDFPTDDVDQSNGGGGGSGGGPESNSEPKGADGWGELGPGATGPTTPPGPPDREDNYWGGEKTPTGHPKAEDLNSEPTGEPSGHGSGPGGPSDEEEACKDEAVEEWGKEVDGCIEEEDQGRQMWDQCEALKEGGKNDDIQFNCELSTGHGHPHWSDSYNPYLQKSKQCLDKAFEKKKSTLKECEEKYGQ